MSAVRDAATLRNIVAIGCRDSGGTLRTISEALIRGADGVLRAVFASLTASASPSAVSGYGDRSSAITITTNAALASPSGGVPAYSYLWTQTGGDTGTILSPTSASTAFQFAGVGPGDAKVGTFICTVTDANGTTAPTSAVTATATNVNTA